MEEMHTISMKSEERLAIESSLVKASKLALKGAKDSLRIKIAQIQNSKAEVVHLWD